MNSLWKAVVCVTCLVILILAIPPMASAQSKVEGTWKITEVTFTGPNARTITDVAPNLWIFTKNHYSVMFQTAHRSVLPENATDAQKLAAWTPLTAHSGTYELEGTTLTAHPIVAKNPPVPGEFLIGDFSVEGNTLTFTLTATRAGLIANPVTVKLARVE